MYYMYICKNKKEKLNTFINSKIIVININNNNNEF